MPRHGDEGGAPAGAPEPGAEPAVSRPASPERSRSDEMEPEQPEPAGPAPRPESEPGPGVEQPQLPRHGDDGHAPAHVPIAHDSLVAWRSGAAVNWSRLSAASQ